MSSNTEEYSLITLKVKTTTETHEVVVKQNATIRELKEVIITKVSNATLEQLCVIFSGKILKDHETLSELGLQDGFTLHLVVRSKPKPAESTSSGTAPFHSVPATHTPVSAAAPVLSPAAPSSDPLNLGGLGAFGGLGGLGGMNLNQMQQNLLSNPEAMRQMMDSPIMQGLLSNPDIMRSMILNNPQMQQLMERNPEVGHMLNNPDLLRQTMDMVRNPAALQELMRSHDRAVSNLEAIPGGMAALQRMYRDIQEPMMDAAQQQITDSQQGNAQSARAGTENRDPLPNPWAPRSANSSNTQPSTSRPAAPAGAQATQAGAGVGQNFSGLASIVNSPGYQSLLNQMVGSPEVMQSMLSAPHMQQVMQSLSQNPAMMDMVLSSNPVFANNPQLQEQVRRSFPQLLQQMQQPEVSAALTNPRVMRAMQQIQEGMQVLQQEAPFLLPGMNTTSLFPTAAMPTSTASSGPATGNTITAPPSATGPQPTTPVGANFQQLSGLSELMQQLLVQPGTYQQPPEERYRSQLETLSGMGFLNREANIQALVASFGNIEAAIERLLNQPHGGNFS